ncbi:LysM peptidoglycan-binding domain-containing protein [Heliobacterium undosum]|uniref:LysM peptidoglycan-binding domain-containing protein n=1 Tax=Heliomicrobium undosum TaxID=121734 RepID=A0A845L094_9FIRM|nr:LysM peptidoglycan-binding domain-containing protein [Heliomicrobium undosum]
MKYLSAGTTVKVISQTKNPNWWIYVQTASGTKGYVTNSPTYVKLTPATQVAGVTNTYTVKSGDTLWRIASSQGVSVTDLMKANNLTSGAIYPGQTLQIPASSAGQYRVVAGDTMWKIASKLGVSLNSLLQANPGVDANQLYVGQVLKVPQTSQAPAPQPAPQPAPAPSSVTEQVVQLVNAERAKAGLKPLRADNATLNRMARDKAVDMIQKNYFSHTSPTYGSPFAMMDKYGIQYGYAGENIAKGQTTAQQVMNDWMNSSGHRANILSPNFDTIGVGYYQGAWVQEFISAR